MALSKIKANSVDTTSNLTVNSISVGGQQSTPYTGFKNRIINGAFEVWQRNNTSRTFAGAGTYSADRWTRMLYQDAAHERVSVTPVTGMTARYAIRASSATTGEAAGGSRIDTSQKIESVNCFDLAGQTFTLSFWIRFSSSTFTSTTNSYGNFYASVNYNTTTTDSSTYNDYADGQIFAYGFASGSAPTVWTKVSVTGTAPSGLKNLSLRFQFDGLGNTASAGSFWYEVTEIQLEKGPVATPFEWRSYPQELAMCQRYYEQIAIFAEVRGITYNSGYTFGGFPYKVTKRTTTPTVTTTMTNANYGTQWYTSVPYYTTIGKTGTATINFVTNDADSLGLIITGATWSTTPTAIRGGDNSTSSYIYINAEI